jgi:hypothetical protein
VRKPTGTWQKRNLSREAAAEIPARPIAIAASRLATIFVSLSAGFRPQLHAAATSWLMRATSKSASEGNSTQNPHRRLGPTFIQISLQPAV